MVIHTPTKLQALRQQAAARGVPPSVQAAAAAAVGDGASDLPQTGAKPLLGDLLATDDQEPVSREPVHHDFDTWDGDVPPGA